MQLGSSVRRALETLLLAGAFVGFLSPCASANSYSDAIDRASRMLPQQPDKIVIVERPTASSQHAGGPRSEAFVNLGEPTVYLVRQGATLQRALDGPGIFDFALAAIIWHEMAHIEGADEPAAQRAEEQLWKGFILARHVDSRVGMRYLALLRDRR
jgi:hypothetical protein